MGPLARFITLTEVDLVCVDSEPAKYATAGLVMCGRGYDTQPWLKKALGASNSVVAVLLADIDPGVKNARSVDLRSWPGRSADRTVLALAEWLKSEGKTSFPGMSTRSAAPARTQRSQNIGAFVVLLAIVGLFFLMTRLTDIKSGAVSPLGQSPTDPSMSSTATPMTSADTNPAKSAAGSTSGVSNSQSDMTRPGVVETGSFSTARSSTPSAAPESQTVRRHVESKSRVADSQTDPIAPNTSHGPNKIKPLRPSSRADLDQCYLLRRADGGVPPRACLISNAARFLDAENSRELL